MFKVSTFVVVSALFAIGDQSAMAQDHAAPAGYDSASARPVLYPLQMRTRLIRILEAEWVEGGKFTIAADGTAHPSAAPEQGAPAAFGRIQAYWSLFSSKENYVDFNRRLLADRKFGGADAKTYCAGHYQGKDSDAHIWGCMPWSAAFISWVFQTTGVLQREFPRGAAHREYVDALLSIHQDRGRNSLFIPKNNGTYKPIAGDLICADRTPSAAERLKTFEARIKEVQSGQPPYRPMHCDIVSDIKDSEVGAIGGNVRDRVAKTIYTLDQNNRLTGDKRDFFVLFQNRIGMNP